MRAPERTLLPLSFVPAGKEVTIREITSGERWRHRLLEMGFNRGTTVRVISNHHGPLIVALYENRIALSRGVAHKILVQEE